MIHNIPLKITYQVFIKTAKYFMKLLPNIKHTYNDLLVFLKLKVGEYSEEILKKAYQFSQCTEDQKEQLKATISTEELQLIEKIIAENFNYKKLAEYFIKSELKDVFNIIELATDKTLSEIKDIDREKLLDLLLTIMQYPLLALQSAQAYKQQFEKIEDIYEFLISYNDPNRKKDPIDEVIESEINFKPWNIYDLVWLSNNLITPLRKDKYSIEWLENCELEDLFICYLELNDRNTVQAGEHWYRDKLREIVQKCEAEDVPTGDKDKPNRKRTDEEKAELAELLTFEYFLHERLKQEKIDAEEENKNEYS